MNEMEARTPRERREKIRSAHLHKPPKRYWCANLEPLKRASKRARSCSSISGGRIGVSSGDIGAPKYIYKALGLPEAAFMMVQHVAAIAPWFEKAVCKIKREPSRMKAQGEARGPPTERPPRKKVAGSCDKRKRACGTSDPAIRLGMKPIKHLLAFSADKGGGIV